MILTCEPVKQTTIIETKSRKRIRSTYLDRKTEIGERDVMAPVWNFSGLKIHLDFDESIGESVGAGV